MQPKKSLKKKDQKSKLKLWDQYSHWDQAESVWDEGAKLAAAKHPLKKLKTLPHMPGITKESARFLKWKSFKYMLFHREGWKIFRHFLKRPLYYGWNYLRSLFRKKAYVRKEDFFLYGLSSKEEFLEQVADPQSLLVIGFSYCQKPFECPSLRFTPDCIHESDHPVCRQCDIGKVLHALPETNVIPLIIPTVHYIGDKIFEIAHANRGKKVLFLITACEMTLEMFGDWGNMVDVKGIGLRLDGRICNTMKAFELSEEGIKPGLTVLRESTQEELLKLIAQVRKVSASS